MTERRGRPLRVTVVTTLTLLIFAATGIVVAVSATILAVGLGQQRDNTLSLAIDSEMPMIDQAARDPRAARALDLEALLPAAPGTLQAVIVDGEVVASVVHGENYELRELSPAESEELLQWLRVDTDEWSSVSFTTGDSYRAVAIPLVFNESHVLDKASWVTGVLENPTQRLTGIFLAAAIATALIVTLAAAWIGSRVVRRATEPLEHVAALSDRVAQMSLAEGAIMLEERVPTPVSSQHTEAGRVGRALNRLLDNVAASLIARHRTEEAMRRFVAEASHELRNPLAAIRGYADHYAHAEGLPADAAMALQRIDAESSRLGALVEELLMLAKLDAGRSLRRDEVDLSLIVLECTEDARMAHPDHRWRIVLPSEPVLALADEAALRQVLANLCGNAGSHTPEGTEIVVSAAADGERVLLDVCDDGPGIPAAALPGLFDRFTQGTSEHVRSRKPGSVGLGLAIVSAIAEASDGKITAESRPGRTVFRLELPAAAVSRL